MFKKSLLAAALLIAGGTAANAAEIGVRHTWGNVDRQVGHASFINEGKSWTAGVEQSSGFAIGIEADGFDVEYTRYNEVGAEGGFGADLDLATVGTIEDRFGFKPDAVNLTTTGTISGGAGFFAESEDSDRLEVDGSLTVAGSEYTRNGVYGGYSYSRESGSFSETSNRGFSELSTFSR